MCALLSSCFSRGKYSIHYLPHKHIYILEKLSLNTNTHETRLGSHRVASVVSRGSQDPNPTIPPGAMAHCHGLRVLRMVTRQPRKPEGTVCTVPAGSPFIPDHDTPVLLPGASLSLQRHTRMLRLRRHMYAPVSPLLILLKYKL